jgi:DNA-binding CsgD family transcriptional regulator
MEASVGTNVLVEDLAPTMVHVNRSLQIGDFTESEVRLFAAVLPSIQRGVQLQRRLAAAEMERTTSESAFDRLSDAVVIVDEAFRIRFANRSAAEILADADGLRCAPDGIAAADTRETAVLRQFIAGQRHGGGDGLPPSGGRCQVSRLAGRAPLSVLVVPVRMEAAWLSQRQPNAILFVTDPDRQRVMKADVVGRRFLLTQAEVRVVAEVAKGDGAEAVATRLGIGLATVRTHMHHIFEKTGTHRQAELVGLVMQSQTRLRED